MLPEATPGDPSTMRPLVVSPVPTRYALPEVRGAEYVERFLTAEGEARLIAFIDHGQWLSSFKRRRMDFGFSYNVVGRGVGEHLGPLPPILQELGAALVEAQLMRELPEQAIVQEYLAGQSIAPHTDLPAFGPDIVSLSLGQRSVIVFTHEVLPKYRHLLEARSALALRGPARSEWQHAIPGRRTDPVTGAPFTRRLSVTFRTVR